MAANKPATKRVTMPKAKKARFPRICAKCSGDGSLSFYPSISIWTSSRIAESTNSTRILPLGYFFVFASG